MVGQAYILNPSFSTYGGRSAVLVMRVLISSPIQFRSYIIHVVYGYKGETMTETTTGQITLF